MSRKWQVYRQKSTVLNFRIPGHTGMHPRQVVWLLLSDVQPVERRAGWLPYNPQSALVLSGTVASPGISAHRCWQLPVGEHTGQQCLMGRSWGGGW